MENTLQKGYITEKLLHALVGGCLPIYYGSKEVYDIFRSDSFIYFDINNPQEALEEIRRIESSDDEYRERTSRKLPLLKGNADGETTIDKYYSLTPNIGSGTLNHKIHQMMGL